MRAFEEASDYQSSDRHRAAQLNLSPRCILSKRRIYKTERRIAFYRIGTIKKDYEVTIKYSSRTETKSYSKTASIRLCQPSTDAIPGTLDIGFVLSVVFTDSDHPLMTVSVIYLLSDNSHLILDSWNSDNVLGRRCNLGYTVEVTYNPFRSLPCWTTGSTAESENVIAAKHE